MIKDRLVFIGPETSSTRHSFKYRRRNCEHTRSSVLDLIETSSGNSFAPEANLSSYSEGLDIFRDNVRIVSRNGAFLLKRLLCLSTSRAFAIFEILPSCMLPNPAFVKFAYRLRAVEFQWMQTMHPELCYILRNYSCNGIPNESKRVCSTCFRKK